MDIGKFYLFINNIKKNDNAKGQTAIKTVRTSINKSSF